MKQLFIESAANPFIKLAASLQEKKYRKEHGLFIAEGSRIVSALLNSSLECTHLITSVDFQADLEPHTANYKSVTLSRALFSKISTATQPSGVLGIFKIPQAKSLTTFAPGPVCAQISDPGNLGTLIRSSVAFGFNQIILIECADPYNPKCVQASAGTIGHAELYTMSWQELQQSTGRPPLAALVVDSGEHPKSLKEPSLIVIGNEAHGLPQAWQNQCERRVTLPMARNVESLNAAIAGSLALYLASPAAGII